MNQFAISEANRRILRPPACPSCGYCWTGLPEPRCPECGESVGPGEIVVVGRSLRNGGAAFTGEYWGREMLQAAIYAVIAGAILALVRGLNGLTIGVTALVFGILATMISLLAAMAKRNGRPLGVLRFSSEGYRVGADSRIGPLRKWKPGIRFKADCRVEGYMRLQGRQMWGPLTLRIIIDQVFTSEGPARVLLLEYLERWTTSRITVLGSAPGAVTQPQEPMKSE